jgi:hypothetical protein
MSHWLDKTITLLQADTFDLRELARIAGADPKTFYRGIRLADLDVSGQNVEDMEFADRRFEDKKNKDAQSRLISYTDNKSISVIEAARELHRVGRQEERVAILLDLILRNPDDALLLINLYSKDRAKYANRVLKQIETEVRSNRQGDTLFQEEKGRRLNAIQLARIINRPFSRGMPNNRAALLYYMAKHLARYPDINKYLREKITDTRSIFIVPLRSEIIGFLDHGDENVIL